MDEKAPEKRCMLFRRDQRIYAMPVTEIFEVAQCDHLFPLPVPDPRVAGLVLSGHQPVPLIRIDENEGLSPRIVVFLNLPEGKVGIPADEVIRVESLTEKAMPPLTAATRGPILSRWPGLLSGLGRVDGETVQFLDPRAIKPGEP